MTLSAQADYLSMEQFQDVLGRAHFIQPQAWLLGLSDPIDSPVLKIAGIHRPVALGGSFYHLLHAILDENQQPLAYIHVMGKDRKNPDMPVEVAKKGSQLKVFILSPKSNDARVRDEGHKVESGEIISVHEDGNWHLRSEALIDYVKTLNALALPYAVSEKTVRSCLTERLTARHDLPKRTTRPADCNTLQHWQHSALNVIQSCHRDSLVLRRKYVGGLLNHVSPGIFAQVATLTGFPVVVYGYNSNSTGADIGEICGANIRDAVTAKAAPLVDSSPLRDLAIMQNITRTTEMLNAAHWAGHSTGAPNLDNPTEMPVSTRPPALVLPSQPQLLPIAA